MKHTFLRFMVCKYMYVYSLISTLYAVQVAVLRGSTDIFVGGRLQLSFERLRKI